MSRALRTGWYGRAARMALACVAGVAMTVAGAASARADDSQIGKKQAGMVAKEAARARLAKDPEVAAEARKRWQRELDRRIGKTMLEATDLR